MHVRRTTVGKNFMGGGGFAFANCTVAEARALHAIDNADYGATIYESSATIHDGTLTGNLRGLWIQPGAQQSELDGIELRDNFGMGLMLLSASGGPGEGPVYVRESLIDNTIMMSLPVIVGGVSAGSEDIGDAIHWRDGVEAHFDTIDITRSARHDVLIAGPAKGSLHDVNARSGGIVQECGSSSPEVSGTTPAINSTCP